MHWWSSRIQGKKNGCCRVQSSHRALLLQNRAITKSLKTSQITQLVESQITHGTSPENPYPTSKAAPIVAPSPIPQCNFWVLYHSPLYFQSKPHPPAHEIPSPKTCPEVPDSPRPQPRSSLPSQEQVPVGTETTLRSPRKHQASATHHDNTNDPTAPTSPAGDAPLPRFPTSCVRSAQAAARPRHHSPTARCLGSTPVRMAQRWSTHGSPYQQGVCRRASAQSRHRSPHRAHAPTPQGISATGARGLGQEEGWGTVTHPLVTFPITCMTLCSSITQHSFVSFPQLCVLADLI